MKRLLIIPLLLALVFPAHGGMYLKKKAVAATGGGLTQRDSCTAATSTALSLGDAAGYQYRATLFQAAATTSITQIVGRLSKVASPTDNVYMGIFAWSSGDNNVGAQIGTWSNPVASSTIGASEEDVTFTGITGADITATNYYYVVYKLNTADATNYVNIGRTDGCTVEMVMRDADGAGLWTLASSTSSLKYILYSN